VRHCMSLSQSWYGFPAVASAGDGSLSWMLSSTVYHSLLSLLFLRVYEVRKVLPAFRGSMFSASHVVPSIPRDLSKVHAVFACASSIRKLQTGAKEGRYP